MDEATYMKERVDDQIKWLSNKSGKSQKSFKKLRLITIILSVSIPFLAGYIGLGFLEFSDGEIDIMKIAVGLAGVTIAALEGIQSLYKHQDKWIKYRVTSETLKQEKMLFLTKAGMYGDSETPFQAFVARVEGILGGENKQWSEYMMKNKKNEEQKKNEPKKIGSGESDSEVV